MVFVLLVICFIPAFWTTFSPLRETLLHSVENSFKEIFVEAHEKLWALCTKWNGIRFVVRIHCEWMLLKLCASIMQLERGNTRPLKCAALIVYCMNCVFIGECNMCVACKWNVIRWQVFKIQQNPTLHQWRPCVPVANFNSILS